MQSSQTLQDNRTHCLFQMALVVIIACGVILRASKYLPAFSMRGDELAVTLNLLNRSALDLLTKPLDYEQAAPFGFVLLVKALITLLGSNEYILRLPAFAASCASLILMHNLLGKTVRKYGTLLTLAAFAFGNYLIYYSAELKQYSTDVLWTLILLLVFHQHISKETFPRDFVLLAAVGSLALCFSYPAVFVIAGISLPLFLHYRGNKQKFLWISLIGLAWLGIFLILFFALLRYQTQDTYLITFWDNLLSFMPMPPWREISWFPKALAGLFFVVAGLSSSLLLVIPLYLLGLWGFWNEKNWQWALALTIPIGLNILVSGLQKYPFHGRLILYLLPLVFVVLGKGIDLLLGMVRNRVFANIFFVGLMVLLLRPVIPTANSYLFTYSYLRDDLKPVFAYMEAHHKEDDAVYLYHLVAPEYAYYAPAYHLEDLPTLTGQNHSVRAKDYDEELSTLPRGQRIWFVFSFVIETRIRKGEKQNEREYILSYLNENGTRLNEFYSRNNVSSAHLFILK